MPRNQAPKIVIRSKTLIIKPQALKLQRPLPDGSLQVVARGEKQDPPSGVDAAPRQGALL